MFPQLYTYLKIYLSVKQQSYLFYGTNYYSTH